MSSDPASSSHGEAGVGPTLRMRIERAESGSRLSGFVRLNGNRVKRCCLPTVFGHAPNDCSSPEIKDEYYWEASRLPRSVRPLDIVIGDSDLQLGHIAEMEMQIGGQLSVPSDRTDNGDRFIQVCSDRRLFLRHTVLQEKVTSLHPGSSFVFTVLDSD